MAPHPKFPGISTMRRSLRKFLARSRRVQVVGPTLAGYLILALGIPCPAGLSSNCRQNFSGKQRSCCCAQGNSPCCCARPNETPSSCCSSPTQSVTRLTSTMLDGAKPTSSNQKATWFARQCDGPANLWLGAVPVSIPPPLVTWSYEWSPAGCSPVPLLWHTPLPFRRPIPRRACRRLFLSFRFRSTVGKRAALRRTIARAPML